MLPKARIIGENLVPIKQSSTFGVPYHTLWKWCRIGLLDHRKQRRKLECVLIGGTLKTSKEAVERFHARRNGWPVT